MSDQPLEHAEDAIESAKGAREAIPDGVIDDQPDIPNQFDSTAGGGAPDAPDESSDDE